FVQAANEYAFGEVGCDSLGMELLVNPISRRAFRTTLLIPCLPCVAEVQEAVPEAFKARTVPGCQAGGFIQKEQFGVVARRHHSPVPPPEPQHAEEPPLDLPSSPNVAFLVMQDASVAHHRSPFRRGYY